MQHVLKVLLMQSQAKAKDAPARGCRFFFFFGGGVVFAKQLGV